MTSNRDHTGKDHRIPRNGLLCLLSSGEDPGSRTKKICGVGLAKERKNLEGSVRARYKRGGQCWGVREEHVMHVKKRKNCGRKGLRVVESTRTSQGIEGRFGHAWTSRNGLRRKS